MGEGFLVNQPDAVRLKIKIVSGVGSQRSLLWGSQLTSLRWTVKAAHIIRFSLPLVRRLRDNSELNGGGEGGRVNECASECVTDLCVWLYMIVLPS